MVNDGNKKTGQIVMDYYRDNPGLYRLDDSYNIRSLDESKLVQSPTFKGSVQIVWSKSFRDYFNNYRQYLGRIVIDDGQMISLDIIFETLRQT